MTVALVFPPPFDLTQPYIGLPMLASYLQRQGYHAYQFDLNIAYYNSLSLPSTLTALAQLIRRRLARLGSHSGPAAAELRKSLLLSDCLVDSIPDIDQTFRDKARFLDPVDYDRAMHLLTRLCEIVSAAHAPTTLTPNSLRMRYRTSSMAQLLESTEDQRENPFLRFFETVAAPSILETGPSFVGISVVFSDQLIAALSLARCLKQLSPTTPVVVGGEILSKIARHRPSGLSLLTGLLDAVAVDDGRLPLLELCCRYESSTNSSLVQGTRLVSPGDHPKLPAKPAMESDLEEFGVPDYSRLVFTDYLSPEPLVSVLLGKGCAWGRCSFCTESFTKSYIAKSIPFVLAEIRGLTERYGVKCVNFADSDIAPPLMRRLAEGLIGQGIDIFWSCRARLDPRLTPELCALLHKSGCRKIYFGLESGSQRVLKLMRKGTSLKNATDVLAACSASGISTHLFSFVGFPGETHADAQATAQFLVRNASHIGSFNIGAFNLREESDVYLDAAHYGIRSTLSADVDGDFDDHPYTAASGIQMHEGRALAYKLAASVFDQISSADPSFSIHRKSRYVTKRGMPAWDSHNLLYLSEYPRGWFKPATSATVALNGSVQSCFVELGEGADGNASLFAPETGKVHAVGRGGLALLRQIDAIRPYADVADVVHSDRRRAEFLHLAVVEGLLRPV